MLSWKRFIIFLACGAILALATWFWIKGPSQQALKKPLPNQGHSTIKKMNRLGAEKSPYLLQHRNNPVNWFSWGPQALQAAREENKLIFLSIGYSTCYWCHVMEKDSFEREDVANELNRDFISIKVDREERPDLDRIYMDAVVRMAGRGGWPMSVFLTPDLKPFYGGTFFRRRDFLKILAKIQDQWQNSPQEILSSANKITQALSPPQYSRQSTPLNQNTLKKAFQQLLRSYDAKHGGFGKAPKFPQSPRISFLLRFYTRTGNAQALTMATHTLNQMARGGMFDQLGGGFHRYSTDARWLAPHFEKMLYDNALLAITYLEAFQVTQNKEYAQIARGILDYVLREMTSPHGGFYSAQDAGEVGKEGEFYVWKYQDIQKQLSPAEWNAFRKVYPIKTSGNFHRQENILTLAEKTPWKRKTTSLVLQAQKKLLKVRSQRPHPHKDDKILTAWNGLMIAAMAKGHQILGDPKYLHAAQKAAQFIKYNLQNNQQGLLRRYRDSEARYPAYLNDYAFLIYGLLELYQNDFDAKWLDWSLELQKQQDQRFWDKTGGGYFQTQLIDKSLLLRKKANNSGAIPSGNSIAAINLLKLKDLTFEKGLEQRINELWRYLAGEIQRYPAGYPQTLVALDYKLGPAKEIAIVPGKAINSLKKFQFYLRDHFFPNQVLAIGNGLPLTNTQAQPTILRGKELIDDETTFYICENQVCKRPTNSASEAMQLLSEK